MSTQTEMVMAHVGAQTDSVPVKVSVTKEVEIQTELFSPERSRSSTPDDEEEMISSSSTVRPPTPKPIVSPKIDPPPSYSQVTETDDGRLDEEQMAEALKKRHRGLHVPIVPVAGGVSAEVLEDWQALKDEIGVDCLAIDKVLDLSMKTDQPRIARSSRQARKGSKFYNIYNTFVYKDSPTGPSSIGITLAPYILFTIGLSALGVAILTPAQQYPSAGSATYYDRQAWSSFNTMSGNGEGFSADGAAAIWSLFGRVGYNAARVTRGWPS